MPNPKRRHSRARGRLRRTFYKLETPNFSICPQCFKAKLPHKVCPHCGYYKGKALVTVMSVKEKKEERRPK